MFDLPDEDAALHARVCVIGSGFAGAIVAVELARAGIDVLVLEAGSADPDHRLEGMLDRVDAPGRSELRFGFSRQLGGASNLWAGRLATLEPIDLEARDWVPYSGWPLSWDDLAPYFARAAEILGVPTAHDDVALPEFLAGPRLDLKFFQWASSPFHAGRHLTHAALGSHHLRVVTNAPVVELLEREDARSVEAALVARPGGGRLRVGAEVFVIAAGGIQTPRLLLSSTSVRAHGIGNDHGVVGRFLSTHPKANMATVVTTRPVGTRHPLFTDHATGDGILRCGVGFSHDAQRAFRLLNHYVQVLPFWEHRANRLFEAVRGSRAFNSPLIDRSPLISGFLPGAGKIAFEMMGRLGGVQRRARGFVLRAFLDQYPNPENRVTLSEKKDEDGMPLANLAWHFSPDDRASVLAFFATLSDELKARGLARLDYRRLRDTEDWPLIGIHSHYMGTTRMGEDAGTSVTNGDCRVHGSENVFVAGPSLFPSYGHANPVHTVAALALRLADHARRKLAGEQ